MIYANYFHCSNSTYNITEAAVWDKKRKNIYREMGIRQWGYSLFWFWGEGNGPEGVQ